MKLNVSFWHFSQSFVFFRYVALAFVFLLGLSSCEDDEDDAAEPQTITEIVASSANFTYLLAAVQKAELATALGSGSLTVFAPTDAAFQAAGFETISELTALTKQQLQAVLQYHVLGSETLSGSIPTANNTEVTTLGGLKAYITKNASGVSINGAKVTQADVDAENGVIHVIDFVLMPPTQNLVEIALADPDFSLLVAAVLRASEGTTDVASVLTGNTALTVFAPTNEAFQAAGFEDEAAIEAADPDVLANILTYHVVPGRVFSTNLASGDVTTAQGGNFSVQVGTTGVTVQGDGNTESPAQVIGVNALATNGVIHVIDKVLLP
jgi:uncharacterized surface protein with fasciclin (FAS1) repeats